MEFKAWPKIKRIENKRPPVFTEKLDGTNACIVIPEENPNTIYCQSKTRFITVADDNFGFASWVSQNHDELLKLGPGYHYGEWWGLGIQRGYGLSEKRFSLFNTRRWGLHNPNTPSCISVVPIIEASSVEEVKQKLIEYGSFAVPGWGRPEGAVMYEPNTDTCFKIILDK